MAVIMRTFPLPARTALAMLVGLLAAALLEGCATGMAKDECQMADWRTIGYEDGLHGFSADRIGAHRVACAKFQVAPDLAAYNEGRQRGLLEYCKPRNGYRAGLSGQTYANVCPTTSEPAFVEGYRYGRQIYEARAELRNTQARLKGARDGLVQTDVAAQAATAELVQPRVSAERRVFLAQELVRLGQERSELQGRIQNLTLRTGELAETVHQLERQSPYAL
jgi:hypothetical protein